MWKGGAGRIAPPLQPDRAVISRRKGRNEAEKNITEEKGGIRRGEGNGRRMAYMSKEERRSKEKKEQKKEIQMRRRKRED